MYNDHEACVVKFDKTKSDLIALGIREEDIVVPTELVPKGCNWETAMDAYCIPALTKCNAIFMQSDWVKSKGARIEFTHAYESKMDIFFEDNHGLTQLKYLIGII